MVELISFRFVSNALSGDTVRIHRLEGREEIGRCFEFEVHLVTLGLDEIDEDRLLTEAAAIELLRGADVERTIHGAVAAVRTSLDATGDHLHYRVTFRPRLARLSLTAGSEVFIDESIPQIIQHKLERAGLKLGDDFELRLLAAYAPRDFVMQYAETDLAFVCRLAEHWGISLFFEHHDGRDVAVFSDDNSGFLPTPGLPTAPFRPRGEALGVYELDAVTRTISAAYVVDDYNYRTPSVALRTSQAVAGGAAGAFVEYGPHCKTPDEATLVARVRSEELAATRRVLEGTSALLGLSSGARTALEGHPRADGELLVVSLEHHGEQPAFGRTTGEHRYRNAFRAIPASVPFRPARVTPKPRVHGAITAVVEAAESGQYADLDDDGRYHVRFKCDGSDAGKAKASKLVRMAQPHAGPGYGMHFPLRDGVEVLLTCVDGDPDRPIITGAVPNPLTPSVVGSRNATRNVIRTGGGTELNIDDTDASTRFKVTVPYANTVLSLGAPSSPEGFRVGTDQQALLETGTSIALTAGTKVDVTAKGGDITETASAGITLTASGGALKGEGSSGVNLEGHPQVYAHATNIGLDADSNVELAGNAAVHAKSPLIHLDGSASVLASAPMVTASAGAVAQVSGAAMVQVDGSIVIITGASSVTVSAPSVNVSASGTVNVKGGTINLNS
ncbi:MAG TPA: type VI secretion system tip protein TssI/VgrG [Minicystis sp.]|nr:type VI secretion system tip protein TssI/VgrG [Minicystis sp.]